jgi:hypothetical protein
MENWIIMKKSKFVSKFKQNDRENVIIESVFIIFKRTGPVTKFLTLLVCSFYVPSHMFSISQVFVQKQMSCLTGTCLGYLSKYLFLACFQCLISSQKYWI